MITDSEPQRDTKQSIAFHVITVSSCIHVTGASPIFVAFQLLPTTMTSGKKSDFCLRLPKIEVSYPVTRAC